MHHALWRQKVRQSNEMAARQISRTNPYICFQTSVCSHDPTHSQTERYLQKSSADAEKWLARQSYTIFCSLKQDHVTCTSHLYRDHQPKNLFFWGGVGNYSFKSRSKHQRLDSQKYVIMLP